MSITWANDEAFCCLLRKKSMLITFQKYHMGIKEGIYIGLWSIDYFCCCSCYISSNECMFTDIIYNLSIKTAYSSKEGEKSKFCLNKSIK